MEIFGNCFGNNSAAPYVVPQPPVGDTYEDPDYAVPLDTVVQYPSTAAYFGYQTYVFTSAMSNYTTSNPLQVIAPHGSNPASRYELFARSAANAWLNNVNAYVKVYKVSKTTAVTRYPTNRYTPRSSHSELALTAPLDELAGLLNGWLTTVQPTQTIETQSFQTLTVYNPVTQTPRGLVGSECLANQSGGRRI